MTKETTLEELREKYAALEKLFNPIKEAAIEYDARADFVVAMDKELAKTDELVKKVKNDMPWLKAEDVEKAVKKVEDFSADWQAKKEDQAKLKGYETPVFTKKGVEDLADEAFAAVRKLSKTKKPKERKTKTRGKNQDKKGSKKARASKEVAADLEKLMKELDEIRAKKTEAVEKEDYDAAENLKKDELAKKENGDVGGWQGG